LKSQNYKNISDLSIGFASITEDQHVVRRTRELGAIWITLAGSRRGPWGG